MNINELKPVLCMYALISGCSSPAIPDADIVFVNDGRRTRLR